MIKGEWLVVVSVMMATLLLSGVSAMGDAEMEETAVEHRETSTSFLSGQSMEEQQAILANPDVQAVVNAKAPDAVDRLIAGILAGTGKGGVVTSEFQRGNVHATIISNVNELKVLSIPLNPGKLKGTQAAIKRVLKLRQVARAVAKAPAQALKTTAAKKILTQAKPAPRFQAKNAQNRGRPGLEEKDEIDFGSDS